MSDFLNTFLDELKGTEIEGYILVEDLRGCKWEYGCGEIRWIYNHEEYNAESASIVELGNLSVVNADTGCGYSLTYVFDKDKKVNYGELCG